MTDASLKTLREVKVFISSPGDVHEERRRVEAALARLGEQAHIKPYLRLNALRWEDVPPEGGRAPQTIIDQHLGEASEADIYICILWHRMGTPTTNANGESFRSGTECEFFSAYRAHETNRRPQLLLYHCQRPAPAAHDPAQFLLVEQFLARFKSTPPELKGLWNHFTAAEDFEDRVFADLNTLLVKNFLPALHAHTQRRDFYQHIPLPPNYVPRAELLAELRAAVLSGNDTIALTSAKAKPTALHGMGGIGKSVMARALCEEEQVQAAFPHGILWTTLGQGPNLNEKLREWIHALGGVISENAPTLDQLKNNLNKLLEGRQCLLVVDDVWRKAHAETFRVGSTCRLLLTTRDAAMAEDLGAMVQPVPLMAREEAVRLLEEWAEGNLRSVAEELQERIVERLGRLPLALRIAGAQLRHREPHAWLAAFDVHQLKAKRIEGMHDSLAKTFALSLEALNETRRLYTALAIFKEDEPIPEPALHKLWSGMAQYDAAQTAELLEDLASRALLTLASNATPRRASLHDLLRDLIAAELHDEQRRTAHAHLLASYRTTCTGAGWHTASDDGYLYDHLVYHLEQAQQWKEIHALFHDQNWMHVRVPQCNYDYDGYVQDVMVAWQHAHNRSQAQIAAHEMPTAIADCVRYALIRTSVNSLAANYEPELVARAVETGLWSARRALSLAAKVPDAEQRAEFFIALLTNARMDDESRTFAQREGLAAARAIEDDEERAPLLVALAPQLTGENLREGLAAAQAIEDEKSRAQVLVALAPQLTGENLREGLAAAQAIEDEGSRAQVLVALAPQLTGKNLREGLTAARRIEHEPSLAQVLVALALQLAGKNLREGLAAGRAIEDEKSRARVLVALAPQLTGEEREQVLREGLAVARAIENRRSRARVLVTLASQFTGKEREQVLREGLAAARGIVDRRSRARVLVALARQLTDEEREQVLREELAAARVIIDRRSRAQVLVVLTPQLTGEEREQVLREELAAMRAIKYEDKRAQVLAVLAPQLTGENLREGLASARAIEDENKRVQVLVALAPQLTVENLCEELEVRAINDEEDCARVLAALAPQLMDEEREQVLREGLAVARAIKYVWDRAQVLVALAPQLAGENLREGLAAARAIEYERERAQVLVALTPQLTGEEREQVLREELRAIKGWFRTEVLVALAPQLVGKNLREGLAAAQAIEDEGKRAQVLVALAPQLAGEEREQVSREGLAAVRAIEDEEDRAQVLVALAPQLTGENLREGLAAARAINDKEDRARVLMALAPQLTVEERERVLREGLAAARAINDREARARVLMALAPQLTVEKREQVLRDALTAMVRAIQSGWYNMQVLVALAPQLTGENLRKGLVTARAIEDEGNRAQVLAALAPQLTGEEREQVLREGLTAARAIEGEEYLARVLAALAPQLTHEQVHAELLEFIKRLLTKERSIVLALCARKQLFAPPILTPEILAAIARHIIEICRKWQWL